MSRPRNILEVSTTAPQYLLVWSIQTGEGPNGEILLRDEWHACMDKQDAEEEYDILLVTTPDLYVASIAVVTRSTDYTEVKI